MNKLVLFAMAVLLVVSSCGRHQRNENEEKTLDTLTVMVTRIQQCSKLYVSEYKLHKLVVYKDEKKLSGGMLGKRFDVSIPMSERKIVIPMDATVKSSVDLGEISEKNISRNGDKITVTLPNPEFTLTSTKIDHAGVKEKISFLRSDFSDDEITGIQKLGRDEIIKSISEMNLIEHARTAAMRQIVPIVVSMGYDAKNVTVVFSDDIKKQDFRNFIKYME